MRFLVVYRKSKSQQQLRARPESGLQRRRRRRLTAAVIRASRASRWLRRSLVLRRCSRGLEWAVAVVWIKSTTCRPHSASTAVASASPESAAPTASSKSPPRRKQRRLAADYARLLEVSCPFWQYQKYLIIQRIQILLIFYCGSTLKGDCLRTDKPFR